MKLKSMALTAADRKAREDRYKVSPSGLSDSGPKYPYGLELHLDSEIMAKLAVDELPAPETEVLLYCRATVTRCSSSETSAGKEQSMALQITKMAITPPNDTDEDSIWPGAKE